MINKATGHQLAVIFRTASSNFGNILPELSYTGQMTLQNVQLNLSARIREMIGATRNETLVWDARLWHRSKEWGPRVA